MRHPAIKRLDQLAQMTERLCSDVARTGVPVAHVILTLLVNLRAPGRLEPATPAKKTGAF
jgi:hypothetical protein